MSDVRDPSGDPAMAPDLDDVDLSDLEVDDYVEQAASDPDDTVPGANLDDALPTPTHHVARMHLNTLNLRTGGFAWFSA